MYIVELTEGDVDFSKLTELQRLGSNGSYAMATAAFIKWLANNLNKLKSNFCDLHRKLRCELSEKGTHRLAPDISANLILAFNIFLDFAVETLAIEEAEVIRHKANMLAAIMDAGETQKAHQASEDPVRRFIDLIGAALQSGRVHLTDKVTESVPRDPERWGWQIEGPVFIGSASTPENTYRPRGEKIGWVGEDRLKRRIADGSWELPGLFFSMKSRSSFA